MSCSFHLFLQCVKMIKFLFLVCFIPKCICILCVICSRVRSIMLLTRWGFLVDILHINQLIRGLRHNEGKWWITIDPVRWRRAKKQEVLALHHVTFSRVWLFSRILACTSLIDLQHKWLISYFNIVLHWAEEFLCLVFLFICFGLVECKCVSLSFGK